ncbi:CehA/McbA family metallohydrolase [Streptomyces sp. AM2-3-1]|uniref:CehA/McbA family metallohydrolase n=1 Tax=Streptomyces sp. AM2-3-1 TaxID=3075824 RepID=UPI0028C38467|nr:CehA/McbA family metallohydrolase [Streptomyces sp. AM2-3-1]WNO69356.1 CehA/McbA family metallohydrolase [Streptomyces sp. AM2-3-1]
MDTPENSFGSEQAAGAAELTRRRFVVAAGAAVAVAGIGTGSADAATGADLKAADRTKPGSAGSGRSPKAPKGLWLAGDTHVHDDHSSDGSGPRQTSHQTLPGNLPVGDQIGQGEKTGLDFMPLTDHRTYDQVWDPQWKSSKLLLLPGEEANGSPHAIVLGNVDVVVDGANPAGSASYRHVQQSIWDVHAQDAVWSQAHPDDGEYTRADGVNDNASVQGADIVEVLNVASNPDVEVEYAENRWNAGFRFGVVAASDCHFRELWDVDSPGEPTTHVFVAQRSVRGILDGFRDGRTTVSQNLAGPFLTIEADVDGDGVFEAMGGDEVVVADRKLSKKASLRVKVKGGKGTTLYVYAAPGRSAGPVATFRPQKANETYELPLVMKGTDHSWYRVEARSPGSASGSEADPNLPDQLRGATSPIFLSVGAPAVPKPEIALPVADARADKATLVAGEQGKFTGFSDVAVSGKNIHLVAEAHEKQATKVVYRRLDSKGRLTKALTLSERSATARFPRVVASGDNVWVVWQDELGREQPHQPVILLAQSTDGGHSFKSPVKLSKGKGRAINPAIALLDDRHPLIAWSDNSGGAFDVFAQIVGIDKAAVNISAAGKTVSAGVPTDARSPRYPASLFPVVAVNDDRRAVISWQDDRFDPDPLWTGHTPPAGEPATGGTDPDNWQILASVRKAPGRSWDTPVQVSRVSDRSDRHPGLTVAADGTFVAIWESGALQSSGANLELRSSRSADGGKTWTAFEQVALAPEAMSQRAALSRDPNGTVRAVWYDSRSTDWRWKVFTATLDSNNGWSEAQQVTTRGNNTWPALDQGVMVCTSDRAATRTQRDRTQQVYLAKLA